jgi:hypothetical protein
MEFVQQRLMQLFQNYLTSSSIYDPKTKGGHQPSEIDETARFPTQHPKREHGVTQIPNPDSHDSSADEES